MFSGIELSSFCHVLRDQVGVVRALLAKGANAEARNKKGLTPLIRAAFDGHVGSLQVLLAQGVAIEARDNDGQTALMLAAMQGQVAVIPMLIAKGAHIEAADNDGQTVLMLAAFLDQAGSVQTLLNLGANVNVKDNTGVTALMLASHGGHLSVVQALLKHGAEVNAKSNSGLTALKIADNKGHTEIIQILREALNNPCPNSKGSQHVFELNGRGTTGIAIQREDKITFRVSGYVTFGAFAGGGGPEGIEGFSGFKIVANARHGAMLARISAEDGGYNVGAGGSMTAQTDGILTLAVNDTDVQNNTRQFKVEITICRAK